MATPAAADDVLFFIPDIGGFTKFIAETEIQHSQHIIQELLELLVDANTLGMKVGEFEGDAVLFYRNGAPPSLEQLVQQARKMYLDFHSHLKKMEFKRICQCGACASAGSIALKMVAHFGTASTMQVKDHVKFIGKDIIIAHRLLKNSVTVPEYLLVSGQTLSRIENAHEPINSFAKGSDAYESLGTIEYQFKSLDGYKGEVKVDPPVARRAEESPQDDGAASKGRRTHRVCLSAADRSAGAHELDRGRHQGRNVRRPAQPDRQDASVRRG